MTHPAGNGTANRITGGLFLNTVVQGRDIQVVLPHQIQPALTGLPRPSAVFTGRQANLCDLLQALDPARPGGTQLISAVAGMGGIGKTELVLHTAAEALGRTGWFPGGVLFVDMAGYDPERKVTADRALLGWLSAIGVPGEHIPETTQDRSRLWRSVLDVYAAGDRRVLLVIDNAAEEEQVTPLLPGGDTIPVLVTSRHTLDLDARLHDLDTLPPDAAVALITQTLTARRGPGDPRLQAPGQHQALDDLVGSCAGLPLALRIVAALLADRPQLHPAALAQRLTQDGARLDGLERGDLAVRAAFDLSHQNLTDDQARVFRLLSLNPGPDVATDAVKAMTGLNAAQTVRILEALHRAHLIEESAPDRWRMHDLIRLYADEHAADHAPDTDAARGRLYGYYRDTTRSADSHLRVDRSTDVSRFGDRGAVLAWLDSEHTNLITVCTTAPRHAHPDITTDLAYTLAQYLYFRRHFADMITISSLARDIHQESGDRHREGDAWNNLGTALQEVRRFEEAIEAHTRARDIYQESGDRHREGDAWNSLGNALDEMRRYDEAIDAHTRARGIFQESGDRHREGVAWNNLGLVLRQVRRFEEAIEVHTRARDIYQESGDRHREGMAWGNLGVALRQVRRFEEAIEALTRARDIFQESGDRHGEGMAWGNLGNALRQMRRFEEARHSWECAVTAYVETGDDESANAVRASLKDL
jgi:tetratricopeptide (TPR) repeat protein